MSIAPLRESRTGMAVNRQKLFQDKLGNLIHGFLLIMGLAALLVLIGWMMAGWPGVWWALLFGAVLLLAGGQLSPRLLLARSNARPLPRRNAPALYAIMDELYQRAGIRAPPALWYVPSPVLNAFAVGTQKDGAITVTSGLLRALPLRPLTGVLAHETSHLQNNDTWVMAMAALFTQLTGWLAFAGQLLLLAMLPMVMTGQTQMPWLTLMLLAITPTVSTLLQLALSRNREFAADLSAAELTGDPQGLASALAILESAQGTWQESIFLPRQQHPSVPRWLRTHPEPRERIERLMAYAPSRPEDTIPMVRLLPGRHAHDIMISPTDQPQPRRRGGLFRL